ncbi:4Fe-4S dicluster domain-containing protein, partial [Kaarinaea lacus]
SMDTPITKGVSGILVFGSNAIAAESRQRFPCIKCGECLKACPMHLNPSYLGLLAAKREYAQMQDSYHLSDCFECGCCTYVCPSGIPLVQYFRIAKAVNREQRLQAA